MGLSAPKKNAVGCLKLVMSVEEGIYLPGNRAN